MAPVFAEFVVMQTAQQVRIVVQPIGGIAHLIKIVAVIARGCPLLGPFADDAQLLTAEFGHLRQHFLKIHHAPPSRPVARHPAQAYGDGRVPDGRQRQVSLTLTPGATDVSN
jgi:hypothetical protein